MHFSVTVSERTIIKWLRKLKRTRLQPRPFHPKRDEAAQEAVKEHFTAALKRVLLGSIAANKNVKATYIPVIVFSVGEEELAGVDTKPLVGHTWPPGATSNSDNAASSRSGGPISRSKVVTNDPVE